MTRMLGSLVALTACLAAGGVGVGANGQAPVEKVPTVAVAGCLTEQAGNTWMLTSASEPVPSIANGPPADQPYTGPTGGKHSFRLIGISEFDLPAHKGHTVLVKGLLITAEPVSRLNVTSVTMLSATCTPPGK
jgi:hypothetical protein